MNMSHLSCPPAEPVLWTFQQQGMPKLYGCMARTFFAARERALVAFGCERYELVLKGVSP